ncbi:MAG: 2-oxoisovalerate dehydrogenase [Gammaproteobacteria bacterium]|nr:2-oxoisovalerate dehydrogenase [Gammaproteobacteria bacterium]
MSGPERIYEDHDDASNGGEDESNGGYSASALGYGIHTQGDSIEELRRNVKEAVDCYFDETMARPRLIRLHFVRDEVLAA